MNIYSILIAGAVLAWPLRAQVAEAQVVQTSTNAAKTTVQVSKEEVERLEAQRKADAMLLKKPIGYSGFVRDLQKAPDKKKLLSLRQPSDPKHDLQNLIYEPRSREPKGFVLFSLDF
jgi:hypothetical protein